MRPAVFLDRDGVINENRDDYVKSWEEFVFLPGVFAPLRRLSDSGLPTVVISNQSAVGRGLVSEAEVERIHQRMSAAIARQGGRVDAVLYCPHHPSAGCDCRKPRPGLLLQAAARLDLDLSRSFLVGDARSDVEAALAVGCRAALVLTGRGRAQHDAMPAGLLARCHVAQDLGGAVRWIVAAHNRSDNRSEGETR